MVMNEDSGLRFFKKEPHGSEIERRFFKYVRKTESCWIWTGCRKRFLGLPYGGFGYQNKWQSAHRVSWILHFGPIPDGVYVLHRCDNPPCVNPLHLELGNQFDNMRHARERGRIGSIKDQFLRSDEPEELRLGCE